MNFLAKTLLKTQFIFSSKNSVRKEAFRTLEQYMSLSHSLSKEEGTKAISLPSSMAFDKQMQNWSFFMLLEHNTKVNSSISAIVHQLSTNQTLHGLALIDFKKDVSPSSLASIEQIKSFEDSVDKHCDLLRELPSLRGTKKLDHPLFADMDAHMWNCMFVYHLKLHLKQAQFIVDKLKA